MNYNEFQTACKTAWESEGMQEKEVHEILRFLGTSFGMERGPKMISEAWKIYKHKLGDNNNKYVLNTSNGTQCSIIAPTTKKAFEKAVRLGWNPKGELPLLVQDNV